MAFLVMALQRLWCMEISMLVVAGLLVPGEDGITWIR